LEKPCGYYMVYDNEYESGRRMKAETLTLPLRKNPDGKPNFFISFHTDHHVSGVSEQSGVTCLVAKWEVNSFADIGSGEPEIDLQHVLSRDSQTVLT